MVAFARPSPPSPRESELLAASEAGALAKVEALLGAGVSPVCADLNGHTPLHKSAFMGFEAVAAALLAAAPHAVHVADLMSNTPLHAAAFAGHARMVHQLLEARAAVNCGDLAGNTPLHRATLEGHAAVAEALLQHGADANAIGSERSTPLHFLALGSSASDPAQAQMAQLLLRHGASPSTPNRYGKSACELAAFQGHRALAALLQSSPPRDDEPAPAAGGGLAGGVDLFALMVEALEAPPYQQALAAFRVEHCKRFVRHRGGDYPLALMGLHLEFERLTSRHLEGLLAPLGHSMASLAQACEQAALHGRCTDASRLRLLGQLAAVDDFSAFFEMMAGEGQGETPQWASRLTADDDSFQETQALIAALETRLRASESAASTLPPVHRGSDRSSNASPQKARGLLVVEDVDGSFAPTSEAGSGTYSAAVQSPRWQSSQDDVLWGQRELEDGSVAEGSWVLGKRIGAGSSGEVFMIHDELSGGEFAAKLLPGVGREQHARQLEQEIAAMRRLKHKNIVRYLGTATCDSESYILMELASGGSIKQMISEPQYKRGLPDPLLRAYGVQLLTGLHFLHAAMIIHRDLKGDNVLLDGTRMTIKIADFGSSHIMQGTRTLSSEVKSMRGSPYWMSPEHIRGVGCGRKADIWSFGCVLLEMLTGQPPWHSDSEPKGQFAVFALLNKIVLSTGPPPMPPPEAMPPHLHALLSACFDRDTSVRPTTGDLQTDPWIVESASVQLSPDMFVST